MKSLKTVIAALMIAGGTIAAFAFTKGNPKVIKSELADLHWFDANTGDPLGERTVAEQQANCGAAGQIDCAYGYPSVDQDGNPLGTPTTVKRQ